RGCVVRVADDGAAVEGERELGEELLGVQGQGETAFWCSGGGGQGVSGAAPSGPLARRAGVWWCSSVGRCACRAPMACERRCAERRGGWGREEAVASGG